MIVPRAVYKALLHSSEEIVKLGLPKAMLMRAMSAEGDWDTLDYFQDHQEAMVVALIQEGFAPEEEVPDEA
jgi:hypothetical protein